MEEAAKSQYSQNAPHPTAEDELDRAHPGS
jgi:hypothetical protein